MRGPPGPARPPPSATVTAEAGAGCRCGAPLREVGHAPAGCVQSKQGLIMHKVSRALSLLCSFFTCTWKESRASV